MGIMHYEHENLKRKPSSGFTLLEIMVALAVIAIALVSLLALGNRSLDIHGRLQKITVATLLAQQKMTETEHQASRSGIAVITANQGEFEKPNDIYSWQRTVAETPLPAVKMVTVTVLWGAAEENERVDVTSFLF